MKRRSFFGMAVAGIVGLFVKKSIEPGGNRFGVTGGNCVSGLPTEMVWIPSNHLSDEEIEELKAEFERPRSNHIIIVDESDEVTWHT